MQKKYITHINFFFLKLILISHSPEKMKKSLFTSNVKNINNLGKKKIYIYKDGIVTLLSIREESFDKNYINIV